MLFNLHLKTPTQEEIGSLKLRRSKTEQSGQFSAVCRPEFIRELGTLIQIRSNYLNDYLPRFTRELGTLKY